MWETTRTIFAQSLERALTALARVAPGLLALLVVFAASVIAAALVRAGLHRLCARIGLDAWAARWGLSSPEAGRASPSAVAANLGTATVLAFGLLLGLAIFDAAAKTALTTHAADYAPHVLAAALIFVAGLAAARALERQLLISAVNLGLQSARLVAGGARWIVLTMATGMALEHLGIGGRTLPILLAIVVGGIVLALALAFGLGARDAVARALERRTGAAEEGAKRGGGQDVQHM
ncbi:MAG TPA: hypothetical protein VLT47_09105 [Anaeromyxobacteraceae bacterium]|nr:hypothetical protein [Anaeromyxobacteraceae bacterium]